MKKYWTHKTKFKNKKFFGFYTRTDGERIFNLKQVGGDRVVTFESFQAARLLGWVYDS